jgi:hypothetical protein
MEKNQTWIASKDLEWAWHINVFSLLDMKLSPIWWVLKEIFQAIT